MTLIKEPSTLTSTSIQPKACYLRDRSYSAKGADPIPGTGSPPILSLLTPAPLPLALHFPQAPRRPPYRSRMALELLLPHSGRQGDSVPRLRLPLLPFFMVLLFTLQFPGLDIIVKLALRQ